MKLGIMQPYFFPYIGYWQLINAVDVFILLDDVQYIPHGWINRNRILKPGGGWQYIIAPLKKHSNKEIIKNVLVHPEKEWKDQIFRQLEHYKKKAVYYNETVNILKEILFNSNAAHIALINYEIIQKLCHNLNINTDIYISSNKNFDYSNIFNPGDWALRIAEQMGASEYINPIGGKELFDYQKFETSQIKLSFIKSQDIVYSQPCIFESSLSIIDIMMFNGLEETKKFLTNYIIL